MQHDTLTPELAREYLKDVSPLWRAYWFHMFSYAKNLREFADGLASVSDDIYEEHVSGQKNDLARWIQEVIGDSELGRDLERVTVKDDAIRVVRSRVEELQRLAAS